jgi:hypothetical protein
MRRPDMSSADRRQSARIQTGGVRDPQHDQAKMAKITGEIGRLRLAPFTCPAASAKRRT